MPAGAQHRASPSTRRIGLPRSKRFSVHPTAAGRPPMAEAALDAGRLAALGATMAVYDPRIKVEHAHNRSYN
jgi:hypothetical protein